ncbi:WD repeat-containing protein [Metarhizium acridum]|uniref:WD repeat-containing protein n=1 Tax=Metarhizium acridum TaxID=92637 RepID=UPI001C6ADF25|nr:WD repeat-containing protein [Metarhizium acridum]
MPGYTLLPKLLDGINSDQIKKGYYLSDKGSLQNRIINLYLEVLLYQARIIYSEQMGDRVDSFARVNQGLLSEVVTLNASDVMTAERRITCSHASDDKIDIWHLAMPSDGKKADATSQGKQEPKESDVGITLDILSATDERNSNRELDTRTIKSLYKWVSSTSQYTSFSEGDARMLWISGAPDACRPMVIWSIVHEYRLQRRSSSEPKFLSLSVCGIGENEVDSVLSVLRSLIYLVLVDQPLLNRHLTDALKSTGRRDFSDFHDVCALTLLLHAMVGDEMFESTIFLIEFGVEGPGSFISFIMTTLRLSDKFKWLISGSNEWFKDSFESSDLPMEKIQCIDLDAENDRVQNILNPLYIPPKVYQIASRWNLGSGFRIEITNLLREASSGSFLRVDIGCQGIQREDPWHASDSLKQLSHHTSAYTDPTNNLYSLLYNKLVNLPFNDFQLCLDVLRTMAAAFSPLDVTELEALLNMPSHFKIQILAEKCFGSLEFRDIAVCFSRKTARNFIIKETINDFSKTHAQITERCLKSVSEYWDSSSKSSCESQTEDAPVPKTYPALYWMRHLCRIDDAECVMDTVINFLTENILKWLDLLVSKKWLSQAQTLISELKSHVQFNLKPKLDDRVHRNQKFLSIVFETHRLINFQQMIQNETDSNASNTLLFWPRNSIIQKTHLEQEWPSLEGPVTFKKSWELPIDILEGHTDFVDCCAYSYDGKLLASGSNDGTVRHWDTVSGNVQHTFRAFGNGKYTVNDVDTIAFSSTGFIAASDCNIIEVWNISTGIQQRLLDIGYLPKYEPDTVRDVSFSTDGSMLVASVQNTIIIWRVPCFEVILHQDVRVHGVNIESVRVSKDGSLLGLTSSRHVSIWKLDNGIYCHAVNGCVDDSESGVQARRMLRLQKELPVPACTMEYAARFAFSPDSKYIATGTDRDYKVCVWDWKSEAPPKVLSGHRDRVTTVSFSPDGSFLASGSWDRTTRIWREPWDVEQSLIVLNHK